MRCMFLGYIFESRPNSCSLSTAGSVKTIGLSINGCAQRLFPFKVSVKENEVPTKKNYSRANIFATKASYIST